MPMFNNDLVYRKDDDHRPPAEITKETNKLVKELIDRIEVIEKRLNNLDAVGEMNVNMKTILRILLQNEVEKRNDVTEELPEIPKSPATLEGRKPYPFPWGGTYGGKKETTNADA